MKRWVKKEDTYLISNFHKTAIQDLSARLGRSMQAVHNRRVRLIKNGIKFKSKRTFLSRYWKNRYSKDKSLINKHKLAIDSLWSDSNFREKHLLSIKRKFSDKNFLERFSKSFAIRRKSS